ncbi:MAG: glycosyltransferase family 2 protein [Methylicorpusculum sp.]|nr:glycosyltransferase family 2 protein [Methylicorpusculum sp.]
MTGLTIQKNHKLGKSGDIKYMKISIVTVVFNAINTIEDTIQSVASQTYSNIEHIVVDGASTDGTLSILNRHHNKLAQLVSEPDSGIYDAMNKGIDMATGDIIGTLNADDFYCDDTVLCQVAETFSDPAVDACFADLVYVDRLDPAKIIRYWKSGDYKDGLIERGWMPAHPTFFVRRSIYEKFGTFDLDFPRQSDFELTMRFLAIHQIKSQYVPKIWIKMRMGGISNNSISGVIKGNLEAYRACRKHGINVGVFFIPRKIFSRLPQFFKKPDIKVT